METFFDGSATDLVAALVDPKRRLETKELDELAVLINKARLEGR